MGKKIPYKYNPWGTQISSNEVHGCATQKTSNKVNAWIDNESQRTYILVYMHLILGRGKQH